MFGKKRKEAGYSSLAEQRRIEEQQRLAASRRNIQPAAQQTSLERPPERVYLASEIIYDEPELEPIYELEPIEELEPIVDENYEAQELNDKIEVVQSEEATEEFAEAELIESEASDLAPEEEHETQTSDVQGARKQEKSAPKPAKFAKLPVLIDQIVSMNLSRSVRLNFAMLLLKQYNKYKDIPAEKAIIVECLKKLIASLCEA